MLEGRQLLEVGALVHKDTQLQSAARLSLVAVWLNDLPPLACRHARAVFARRLAKPAMGGAKKGALVGIAHQISNLGATHPSISEMLLYELTPRFVDKLGERGTLARKAALERVIAHVQGCGNGRAQRRAVQQTARDRLARAMADVGVLQTAQRLLGHAVVKVGQFGGGGRKFARKI